MKLLVAILGALLCVATASAKVKKPLTPGREPAPTNARTPFDPNEAARQIRARLGGVRACYERASRSDPGLQGKLQLGFDVADSGQVARTQVEHDGLRVDVDPAIAASLTACIRTQALNWRLSPENSSGAHVSYVFVFEAAH